MASDNNNVYLTQLTSLIQNSTLLLHQLPTNNVIDWSSIISTPSNEQEVEEDGGNNKVVQSQIDDEDSESSDDDENMFLGGGYSSSEDDEPSPTSNAPFATPTSNSNTANSTNIVFIEDSIDYLNEETSTLLKRAKAVHSALLLSLPPQSQSTSTKISNEGGKKFVEQLISDILSINTNNTSLSSSLPSSLTNKLVQTIAYLTSSKIINNNPVNKLMSAE